MFQPPLIVATCFTVFSMRPVWHFSEVVVLTRDVRFSNRPFGVKHVQTFHSTVDVACGLVLLFGIGTKALPSWDSRTRQNNLLVGLAVKVKERQDQADMRTHPHPSKSDGIAQ
jgi:hypothetical protein